MSTSVFTIDTLTALEKFAGKSRFAALGLAAVVGSALFFTLVTLGVFAFEYEIFYRIFDYLAGDDSAFWTPWIMGCSSMIVVMALHTMVAMNARHFVLRFVNHVAGALVPVYLLGVGTVLAVMLFQDGLGDMLSGGGSGFDINAVQAFGEDGNGSWIERLMGDVVSPVAALLFSGGIGALAIINVFVAHHCLSKAQSQFTHIADTLRLHREDAADLATYKRLYDRNDELQTLIEGALTTSDDALRIEIAQDVLLDIRRALAPAQHALTQLAHTPQDQAFTFAQTPALNAKELEKAVKAISAIDLNTLINHMR